MKELKKIVRCILCVFSVIIMIALVFLYQLSMVEIRTDKDYNDIYVSGIFDYQMMIAPPEEYSALYQIKLSMRKRVAKYMKDNNYKLKSGKQEFIRIDPTFEELIKECFKFEKIS